MIRVINEATSATVELYGDIGASWFGDGWTYERFSNEVKNLPVSQLTIKVKSNGGDVFEAFAIHDAIKALPARVTVDIVGASASAATIIAAAGDRVRISENSRYLVHNAQTWSAGNKEALQKDVEMLESIDAQIVNTYIKRTGKSKEQLETLMLQEKWMTAQEALEWGFVDEIIKEKKVTNLIKNEMTEEEKMEMEALKAENEALKAKLAEYEQAEQAKQEQEMEAEIDNAITAGKITAEAKQTWVALAKIDRSSVKAAIETLPVIARSPIMDEPVAPVAPVEKLTEEKFYANWKAKKYDNNAELYAKHYKEVFGREPQI